MENFRVSKAQATPVMQGFTDTNESVRQLLKSKGDSLDSVILRFADGTIKEYKRVV